MKNLIDYSDDYNQVLQAMACTMGEYNFMAARELFGRLRLRITPLESKYNDWLSEGLLVGETPRRYNSSCHVSINPKRWAEVMATVSYDQLPTLLAGSPVRDAKVREAVGHLVSAFCRFLKGEPFIETLLLTDWHVLLTAPQLMLMDLLDHLTRQPEYVAFSQQIDGEILFLLFNMNHVTCWRKMEPTENASVLSAVFWDNQLIGEKLRNDMRDAWLYNVELLRTGKLEETRRRMTPGTQYYQKLLALKSLHEGDHAAAFKLFTQQLKETGDDVFDEPLTNFAYAVSLGLTNTPEARRTGEKLMKSRKVTGDNTCYAMALVLSHFVGKNFNTFIQLNPLEKKCKDKMCWRLSVLFMHHYQLLDKEPANVADTAANVEGEGYDYLRLLFALDFHDPSPLLYSLKDQTGLSTSLMPKVKRLEPWELALDKLLKLHKPATAKTAKEPAPQMEVERVAYMVNLHCYEVQPKLQKSKDGGLTWSKGRNIALSSFENSRMGYMTAQDRAVARMVESYSYGWYGQVSYSLQGFNVIAALAGCQSVFDFHTGQRIDIVEEQLQITAQPCPNGFSVQSNVDLKKLDSSGVCLTQQGNRQVTVVRVNDKQRQTLELLRDAGVFPKESKQQLTQLLQNMSGSFTVMSPLLKNATDLKRVKASALIAVQIAPAASKRYLTPDSQHPVPLYSIALAVKPFGTVGGSSASPYQQPGQGMEVVSTKINGERVQTERDLKAELANLKTLRKQMAAFARDETDENHWTIDTAQCLALLETVRTMPEVAFVEWPQGAKMRVVRPVITADKLWLSINSVGQWFEIEGDVVIGTKEKLKMAELLERLRQAEGNFIRLEGDEYIALNEQLRRQLQAIDKMLTGRGKEMKIATMNGLQLQGLEDMGAKVKADEAFRQLMQRIEEAGKLQPAVPTNIHAELRPYQQQGFVWMSRLAHWGAGACLADDMGLGKTLQAITLMQSRAARGPQLVIMPTSVLLNWQQELQRFAPALTVKILNQGNRKQIVDEAAEGDVVLSTYGLLVTEQELLASRTWTTIVLDEAHTIKNRDTQTSQGAMQLKGNFRLLLTGTPLQNHLSEIWNLFHFANPGLLGSYQQFTDRFIIPVERDHDTERQRLLSRLLSPFLLRRTKDEVLNELPEKTEITLRVELSPEEQALYDNLRQQAIVNIEESGQKGAILALAEITRLRQAACNPRLINSKLNIASSKAQAFLDLVEQLRNSGHRTLVFSQFTSHLALIREELHYLDIPYLYLDGSTPTQERNRLVREFQTGDMPLFLISLKAGGLGLNLTAADFVIHLDPWWNPAIEDQASDRAHRIGQERPVTVYRLIAAGTIEEKIIRLHQNKRSMADALLQDADISTSISTDDIIRLLRESVDDIA